MAFKSISGRGLGKFSVCLFGGLAVLPRAACGNLAGGTQLALLEMKLEVPYP
jgi:hypothetical protein